MEPSRPASAEFDGLLLVGHGTRDPAGQAEFWQLVETIRGQNPDWLVEGSFLELAAPTIATGLASLAQRGARAIRAVPLVLFAAGHARQDIPRALAAAALDHPQVEVEQAPHLGCQEQIVELSEWRFHEAAGDQEMGPPGDTLLLLVGRGSSDAEATREMHEFAQCRAARRPELRCEVAFLAMAEPPLDRALEAVARSRPARCVVQPHLLFAGQLLADVRHKVSQIARQTPQTEWIVTAHLGPDIRLATAVAQLARQKSSPALTKARTKSPGVTS